MESLPSIINIRACIGFAVADIIAFVVAIVLVRVIIGNAPPHGLRLDGAMCPTQVARARNCGAG